jgi:hypothetical protein
VCCDLAGGGVDSRGDISPQDARRDRDQAARRGCYRADELIEQVRTGAGGIGGLAVVRAGPAFPPAGNGQGYGAADGVLPPQLPGTDVERLPVRRCSQSWCDQARYQAQVGNGGRDPGRDVIDGAAGPGSEGLADPPDPFRQQLWLFG